FSSGREGLMEIALHPDFAKNGFVYLTYTKVGPPSLAGPPPACDPNLRSIIRTSCYAPNPQAQAHTIALARGRLDGHTLHDMRELLVTDWTLDTATLGSRLVFGRDGMLYMSVSSRSDDWDHAQQLDSLLGKVLRLRDDGTAPPDNPFVKVP